MIRGVQDIGEMWLDYNDFSQKTEGNLSNAPYNLKSLLSTYVSLEFKISFFLKDY
jgi:hypothetical protein